MLLIEQIRIKDQAHAQLQIFEIRLELGLACTDNKLNDAREMLSEVEVYL